ncbi:major facilitator superfamily protein, putative [Ichthyophthirius multifiliis]|uniref:Lysosomal dipeptide transporter MFSD1 n=1 Tax=Ichthyophthirius multifiliis TaxID=5932 RepID=G0QLA1_ICHMU|nr:major facilitator superfamily protein, putative [Ichthyophthirius multifiliis]EGR34002.1 major facilitator superfamily protein, putative [Ichthyophthirius multifiliis]|eukprot:XP_004039306.1 major facilitator superfamily protein, putative [Ichthyophthirius multifiliis]
MIDVQTTQEDIKQEKESPEKQIILTEQETQLYIENSTNKILFLLLNASLSFGAFYNNSFQSYVKEQIMHFMKIDQSEYSKFISIPTIPVIFLPILIGPALNYFGNRKGIFCFTFTMFLGIFLCLISVNIENFYLLIIGKTIHNIGSELIGISQGYYYTKWFHAINIGKAFTFGVFVNKIASSISGIIYPQLFKITGNLNFALGIGLFTCIFSFIGALGATKMDRKADLQNIYLVQEQSILEKNDLNKDNKKNFLIFQIQKTLFLFIGYMLFKM